MDVHSTSALDITAPKLKGTAFSGQGRQQYDRLLTLFAHLIEKLADTIRAEDLADRRWSEKLITKGCWEEACVRGMANSRKIRPLMTSVLSQVELNLVNYDKSVSVLREFDGLQDIVQLIGV